MNYLYLSCWDKMERRDILAMNFNFVEEWYSLGFEIRNRLISISI